MANRYGYFRKNPHLSSSECDELICRELTDAEVAEEKAEVEAILAEDRLKKEAEMFASLVLDAFKRQAQDLFPQASPSFLFDREGLRNFADNAKWRYESEKGECAFPVKVLRGQIPMYFHADGTLSR